MITLWIGNFIEDFLQNKWRMDSTLFIVRNDRKLDANLPKSVNLQENKCHYP